MTCLPAEEFEARRQTLMTELNKDGVDAACLFLPKSVFYLTGFSFYATERPIALVIDREGRSTLFVPLLEAEHAAHLAHVDTVKSYPEYPDNLHPMKLLSKLLVADHHAPSAIGVDADGFPGGFGYDGPALSSLVPVPLHDVRGHIERRAQFKTDNEIVLLRESSVWSGLAQRLLQEYTAPGLMETDISLRASNEASRQMVEALGDDYRVTHWGFIPAIGKYRGQVGRRSGIPHAIATGTRVQEGDLLISTATADVGGYTVELERTMVIGQPTSQQREFFSLMLEIQDYALRLIRPGVPCSTVDTMVRRLYEQRDIKTYWRHHTGHSIGILEHEAPFLDIGDHTVIEERMVFTVEPGIYVPDLGGFRHSDTVLVVDSGVELLTHYPRSIEALTIVPTGVHKRKTS